MPSFLSALAGAGLVLASASNSIADVRREGTWPADDKELVSLSVDALPRAEAVRRLANQAGWSIVVETAGTGTVDVRVKQQPAAKVLELILGDGDYVARRDGSLVSVLPRVTPPPAPTPSPAPQASAEAVPAPAAASSPAEPKPGLQRSRGKDRVVIAKSTVIERDEVVKDLAVFGGSAEVSGRVSGDATVFGGSLVVLPGGHVEGDLTTFGGSADLKDGARVDGEVTTFGGSVRRASKASIGSGASAEDDDKGDDDDASADQKEARSDLREAARDLREGHHGRFETDDDHDERSDAKLSWRRVARGVGSAVTRTALLFAFGVMLWALIGRRVEALQGEVVARPMRAFALGAVAVVAAVAVVITLCVTIVGIPLGLFVLCAAIFGAYAGVCAALTAAGAALLHHKTTSPYIQLAGGCVIYLVLSSIPYLGGLVTALAFLIGFGALVATRAAGLPDGERQR